MRRCRAAWFIPLGEWMDTVPGEQETFATYFARYLIGRRGYVTATEPELQPLIDACTYVLVKSDGGTVTVAAIVDREADHDSQFSLGIDEVRAITQSARRYRDARSQKQMPAILDIYEIGPAIIDTTSVTRLEKYRPDGRAKAIVFASLLDTSTKTAWTTRRRLGGMAFRRANEKLLRRPRLDAAKLIPRQREIVAFPSPPFFTLGLIALLAVVFVLENVLALDSSGHALEPSIHTLIALGGLGRTLAIGLGQWWRVFTAPLLHASLGHILTNSIALYLIGRLVEPLVGWRWTAAVFTIAAVSGSLLSLQMDAINSVSTGASGGIVGLFTAGLLCAYRTPPGKLRNRLIRWAALGLILTLPPGGRDGRFFVDNAAHFGGAIGGGVAGLLLLALWPGNRVRPKWPVAAGAVALLFFATALWSVVPISQAYQPLKAGYQFLGGGRAPTAVQQRVRLAPESDVSQFQDASPSDDLRRARSAYQHQYPSNLRNLLKEATTLLKVRRGAEAESELLTGLGEAISNPDPKDPMIESDVRSLLAASLFADGKDAEARDIGRPACAVETKGLYAQLLKSAALCLSSP